MKRILLFVATNVAVLAVIYLVLNILGVGSIMTGHLNVPALEPDPSTPATLSSRVPPARSSTVATT